MMFCFSFPFSKSYSSRGRKRPKTFDSTEKPITYLVEIVSDGGKIIKSTLHFSFWKYFLRKLQYCFTTIANFKQKIPLYVMREDNNCLVSEFFNTFVFLFYLFFLVGCLLLFFVFVSVFYLKSPKSLNFPVSH